MYAFGTTAHWLAVFESFFGPFMLVATAGPLIARLTRPRMRLRFSESAVVAPYEGGRGLMFRFVNTQPSELSDVQVRVSLTLFEETDGKRERNFYPLALERDSVDLFTLHWTVVHPIDAEQPAARRDAGQAARRAGRDSDSRQRARGEFLDACHGARVVLVGRDPLGCEVREHLRQLRSTACSRSTSIGSVGSSGSSPERRARPLQGSSASEIRQS